MEGSQESADALKQIITEVKMRTPKPLGWRNILLLIARLAQRESPVARSFIEEIPKLRNNEAEFGWGKRSGRGMKYSSLIKSLNVKVPSKAQ